MGTSFFGLRKLGKIYGVGLTSIAHIFSKRISRVMIAKDSPTYPLDDIMPEVLSRLNPAPSFSREMTVVRKELQAYDALVHPDTSSGWKKVVKWIDRTLLDGALLRMRRRMPFHTPLA